MAYRIDANNFSRYNRAGNQTTSVTATQQQAFRQAVQESETARDRAGGPSQFDPQNEQVVIVEAGDSPQSIAEDFHVDPDEFIEANQGVLDDQLETGEAVFLPPQDPVLVAESPQNAGGIPRGEEAFRNSIYDRANNLQYDDDATMADRDALRAELTQDARDYLNALPPTERQAASERLLGDERDWQDATVGREAIEGGAEVSFADQLYTQGNQIEYADNPADMDFDSEIDGISDTIQSHLETLPANERGEALQRLYDRDWRDAGPAQIAIEHSAQQSGIELRHSTHAGPEAEAQARDVIDRAAQAGSPEDIIQTYDTLYAEQSSEIQRVLDGNPEASQLLRGASEQGRVDTLMEGWDPQDFHGEEAIKALMGDNSDIGELSEDGQGYLIDQLVDHYADPNVADNLRPMLSRLIDHARSDAGSTTRDLIVDRLAGKALEFAHDPTRGDPTQLANAAMRAASGDLYSGAELDADDTASLAAMIDNMTPEKMASFVGLFGDRDMVNHPDNNATEAKTRLLDTILDMPPSDTASAGVQALFANANDAMDPDVLDQLSQAIAREWHPDDSVLRGQEASRLSEIFGTDRGKALLLQHYMPDQGDVGLDSRVQALALIRANPDIDAGTLGETEDPWQNPAFTEPMAQDAGAPYLALRGDTPVIYSGTDLDNMIGTAMGAQPELPGDLSAQEVEERVAAGELSLFEGEQHEHIQAIVDNIRDYGGEDAAVTVLPILYSSQQTGAVSLPLFRVETSDGSKFVDNTGRQYDSFENWKTENKLPPGAMTYPTDGVLAANADGSLQLSGPQATPETVDTLGEHLTGVLDTAALVGGIVLAGAVIIGTGGAATPLVAAGGVAVGAWGAYRTGTELTDRAEHGQSIDPFNDPDARMLWLNGVASVAGAGAFASAGRLASLARSGAPLSPGLARVIGTTQAASNTADAAAIINMGHYTATNWDQMSGEERMSAVLSMGFWGATMGMNASHGPALSARTIPDMFNPAAQIRNLTAAYSPRLIDDASLPGNEIRIVDDPATGGFVIEKGPTASETDVSNHVRIARLMYQNEGLSGQMRSLFGNDATTPGTRAHQIRFESEKLAPKLTQLSEDLQNPDLSSAQRAQIQAEIDDYSYFLSGLQRAAADPGIDLATIRQPSTGREIAASDGPSSTRSGSSQEAFAAYCDANGVDPDTYVWYRRRGVNGEPDTAALRRADGRTDQPELEVTVNERGERVVNLKPPAEPAPSAAIGHAAETHAIETFRERGYTTVLTAQNPSGHGVDVFMYNPTERRYVIAEIKANSSQLSPDQQLGPTYALDRMRRAVDGEGSWAAASPADRLRAEIALRELTPGETRPDMQFLVIRYDVDRTTFDVSNPRHIDWGSQDGISTAQDFSQVNGPPMLPENPDWLPGDGVP